MMPNYETFTFKGVDSDTMGVLMSTEWLDSIPARRYEKTEIEGRDGAYYRELGFSDVAMDIPCLLRDSSKKQAIKTWLSGEGLLVFNGKEKTARVFDQINFERVGFASEKFSIPFILEPYWYAEDSDTYTSLGTITENSVVVTNLGNTNAYPRLRITPTTDTTVITINNGIAMRFFIIDKTKMKDTSLVIDCEAKTESDPEAVSGLGFLYPFLAPTTNSLYVSGTALVEIARKDRWI